MTRKTPEQIARERVRITKRLPHEIYASRYSVDLICGSDADLPVAFPRSTLDAARGFAIPLRRAIASAIREDRRQRAQRKGRGK